jgi:hypothetical protein
MILTILMLENTAFMVDLAMPLQLQTSLSVLCPVIHLHVLFVITEIEVEHVGHLF